MQQPCPIWIASNPTGLTWKGGASASEAVVGALVPADPRGYADGWMTRQAFAGRVPAAVEPYRGHDPRGRARPGEARQRALSQHQRHRGSAEGARGDQARSSTPTTRRSSRASSSSSGRSRAILKHCVEELRAYFDAGVGHTALRFGSWDQVGQFKRFLGGGGAGVLPMSFVDLRGVDRTARQGRRAAAGHGRGGLGPGAGRHRAPGPREEGARAALREHPGLPDRALHQLLVSGLGSVSRLALALGFPGTCQPRAGAARR